MNSREPRERRRLRLALVLATILSGVEPAEASVCFSGPARVPVGTSSYTVAVNSNSNKIYVGNVNDGTVSVIDGATALVTATVAAGNSPFSVAVNQATDRIYVVNADSPGELSVIDGTTDTVTTTIPIGEDPSSYGHGPFGVAVNPVTNRIYVVNTADLITVIDGTTDTIRNRINLSQVFGGTVIGIGGVAVDPTSNRVYISTTEAGTDQPTVRGVSVFDGSSDSLPLIATVPLDFQPNPLAVDGTTAKIYVPNTNGGRVVVIDGMTNAVSASVPASIRPQFVAVNAGTNRVYLSSFDDWAVAVVDGASQAVLGTFALPYAYGIAVNPANGLVYVTTIPIDANHTITGPGSVKVFAETRCDFVTRDGTRLLLDEQLYRFTGLNIYNASSTGTCGGALASGPGLDAAFDAIGPGKRVTRAWFFQSLATTNGERDWSSFDHTLAVARAHGVKVVATLGNQWQDCEEAAGYKDETWYQSRYKDPDPGGIVSYRDWVAEVVMRYREDPTILAWQLLNEAEVLPYKDAACPPGDGPADLLKAWATDVSGLIKSLDPGHLTSLGTLGGGQCGAQNEQYQNVHDIPTIDLCEYHDYQPTAPMPGDQYNYNSLRRRLDQCVALDKPLFVGEVGIRPNEVPGGTLAHRAAALDAKLGAQFGAGVAGELAWAWSNDGSTLDNFDVGPGDPVLDVLALAPATTTERVSVSSAGGEGNADSGNLVGDVRVSADGRFVAFGSAASNLVAGDTNGTNDVFLRDRALGRTTQVSVDGTGMPGNGHSSGPALSATGRFIAFTSLASNLVAGDTNGVTDVFVRDRILGTTSRVSITTSGAQVAGGGLGRVDISADGRFVVFVSDAADLVAGDTNGQPDVFVHDRDTDADGVYDQPGAIATTRLSVATDGTEGNGQSLSPAISPNGRFVAFGSDATTLVASDAALCGNPPGTRTCTDVFLRDRDVDGNGLLDEPGSVATTLVSVTSSGEQADGDSHGPAVSDRGDVVFWSRAPNLNATPGQADIYVHRRATGATERAGQVISNLPAISADGRWVTYDSFVANGVDGDTNDTVDTFVYDGDRALVERVSVDTTGAQASLGGVNPASSADGRYVAFVSFAPDLVPDDRDGVFDVFIRDRLGPGSGAPTPPGSAVAVVPVDGTNNSTPLTVTFDRVIQGGTTTLTTGSAGPTPPVGFSLGDPPTYYDLSTTATFTGPVTICITYTGISFIDEEALRLYHYAGAWVDVTTSLDTANDVICGSAGSLSPFAVLETFTCAPRPRAPCRPAPSGKASVLLRRGGTSDRDALRWKWTGAGTSREAFGRPLADTGYLLCAYDTSAGTPTVVLDLAAPPAGACAGKPCWHETGTGFTYGDRELTPDGLRAVALRASAAGKGTLNVKGAGANLGLPALPLQKNPAVTVQFRNSAGACWEASYSTATRNDATQFKAKSD